MPSATRHFKNAVYGHLARIGASLASGPRIELLDLLCQGPKTVEALAAEVGHSVANTSRHLQILRQARLVEAERQGVYVQYRVASHQVCTVLHALRQLAQARLLELTHLTHDFFGGELDTVDRDMLLERARRGEVTVLDVRPRDEYQAGHFPGALSIPLAELERRLAELPRDRQIVAYCRGRYCVLAHEAMQLLRQFGLDAVALDEGVPDWRARGLPIEGSLSEPA